MILRETDYHSRFCNEATRKKKRFCNEATVVVHENRESVGEAHSLVKAAAALDVGWVVYPIFVVFR